jgi:hypothetical protein
VKTHAKVCAACAVEDDEDSPRFEEEVGMAWIRGFVEGAKVAGGAQSPGGFCEPHATYFRVLTEKQAAD